MTTINNSEFLLTVFGNAPQGAVPWVAGFKEDPLKVDGRRWGGLPVVNCTLPWFVGSDTNNFVAISTFRKGADGKYHRRKENFAACHLIMVDDIGSKIQPCQIPLEPSYKLETSPGNYQYGYLLAAPGLDGDLIARVIDAMIAQGLATDGKDPGMKGVTRYGRLPVGWNTKAKYIERLGAPFVHQLEEWHPDRRFTLQEIIEAFELDLDRAHTRGGVRVETDDSILKMLEARGLVKGPVNGKAGVWDVICPWVNEHTGRVDSGAAYFQPHFDGRDKPGYRCHHGHCESRTIKDLLRFLKPEKRAADAEAKQEAATWPDPLSNLAYHGLAGDIVRIIVPHSEVAPEAILIQTLTAFGNIVGRGPFYLVEGDKHPTNLFCVLVGETAKGRKGTSWGRVMQVFSLIDDPWARDRVESGLSSGEGLIWAVRDPIAKGEDKIDPGVSDKRLMIMEPEFAGVLRVLAREGNILSRVIRDAWDRGNLATMTKNSPARATGALVSIIGHITADELRRYLDRTEAGNGFANRFLYLCVRRSKCLPEGGTLSDDDLPPLAQRMTQAIEHARRAGRISLSEAARLMWYAVYPELSQRMPGLFGAVTSRAEAQVIRLAVIYALLDLCTEIKPEHLKAAIALWEYAEASARYVFGSALGDPVADEILRALRSAGATGLSRTQIRDIFSRNKAGDSIERALELLAKHRLAVMQTRDTQGRPGEIWIAI